MRKSHQLIVGAGMLFSTFTLNLFVGYAQQSTAPPSTERELELNLDHHNHFN